MTQGSLEQFHIAVNRIGGRRLVVDDWLALELAIEPDRDRLSDHVIPRAGRKRTGEPV